MFKRAVLTWGATLLVLVLTVNSAWSAPAAQTTPSATPTPVAVDTFDPAAAGGRTVVKWYVGLGTGGDPKQIDIQRQVVDQFNKSQNRIYVALQIVDNRVASTTLATQIAAGNTPDILGPVGTVGRATFDGNYLDLTPYIASNGIDLSVYDQAVVSAYNIPGQGQIGLPFAVFPSFVYFNKDLFDEAGLPYPPQNFGELYQGREWNFETIRDLSKKLTVDDRGNDATSPDFAPDRIVQFGWDLQFVVAYGFSRFRIPGKTILFTILVGTIILPQQVTIVPTYAMFTRLGWVGTWLPLLVPHFFGNAYNVFLLRQFFMSIPRDMDEAAMIDGAGPFRTLISVIVPQSWAAITAVCLFHFFFAWNDFLSPLVYLVGREELWPISVGMSYFTGQYTQLPHLIQATALMALALPVAIFVVAQRVFVQVVVVTGVEK